MKFSKDYSKLERDIFTTIRKSRKSKGYIFGNSWLIKTPTRQFKAELIGVQKISKDMITEELARNDADCSRDELISMLEKWYGKSFDDFVLLTLEKVE